MLIVLAGCGGPSVATGPTGNTTPSVPTVPPSSAPTTAPTTTVVASAVPSSVPSPATATVGAAGSILDACPTNDLLATPLPIMGADGKLLEGALVGEGAVGVVLSNQNDNDPCPWLPFARTLRDDGYRVLLYRYGSGGARPSDDLAAAVATFTEQGAQRIVLVGASIGASATVVVASGNPSGVVAAVPLSAVSVVDGRSITRFAEQLTLPTLFVTADHDGSGSSQAVPLIHQLAPAAQKQLLVVPGTAHGWELLQDEAVLAQVQAFITEYR